MAEPLIYRIDSKDRIDFFNAEFLTFAQNHGLTGPSSMLGMSIWTYFADEATADVYRSLYHKVRDNRGGVAVAYRCDSADVRRSVQMEIKWLNNDGIEHCIRAALEEKRPPLAILDPATPRTQSYVKLCSWCGQIQVFPKWMDPEEANRVVAHPGQPMPELTHGICSVCHDRFFPAAQQQEQEEQMAA